jgi:hypothetical protein
VNRDSSNVHPAALKMDEKQPGPPRSVTATMFTPCSNIVSAARHITQFVALCRVSTGSKGDPNHGAIPAWHGSWERPDNGFADRVLSSRCRPARESTTPKSARHGVPHTPHGAGDGFIRHAGR